MTASGKVLRQYQCEGIAELERATKGFLVGDDVGIGKSLVAMQYLATHPELRPFVIVGPLIAMGSWMGPGSAGADCGLTIVPVRGLSPDSEKLPRGVDGYFVNYEILHAWQAYFHLLLDPRAVIVDEGHEVRNVKTREAHAVKKLCRLRTVDMRLWLTATPVVNGVIDLYAQLDCIQPGMWGPMVPYNPKMVTSWGGRYAGAVHDGYGWAYPTETNVDELRYRLKNVLVRRTRAQVRKELPSLQRERVVIDPSQLDETAWAAYRAAAADVLGTPAGGAEIARLSNMSNCLSWAKRKVAVDQAERLAASVEGHKVVVFCWYKRTAKYIANALAKRGLAVFGPIDGTMPAAKRLEEAQRFRDQQLRGDGDGAVFVATLAAAAVALNPLSAAAAALFVDLYWVPSMLIQGEGRVHREGQRAKQVLCQYLFVDNSIDLVMWEALQRKAASIDKAVGDDTALSLCESLGGRSEEESLASFLKQLLALSPSALGLR